MPRGSLPGERRGGREPGTPGLRTVHARIAETLRQQKCDPFKGLAQIANRDVVALGMMTQKELDEPAIYMVVKGGRRILVQPSGQMVANRLIQAELRQRAHQSLTPYLAPQLSSISLTDADGNNLPQAQQVHFYLPENGRK